MDIGVLFEDSSMAKRLSGLEGIDAVYSADYPFDGETRGVRWYRLFPYVFRLGSEAEPDERADGVMVRNIDELGYVLSSGYEGEIITDAGVYTMNSQSVRELTEDGVTRTVYPLEANFHELRERGYAKTSVLVVYGRAMLMISANCVRKNALGECSIRRNERDSRAGDELCKLYNGKLRNSKTGNVKTARIDSAELCKLDKTSLILTDRKGVDFPVICDCRNCCNVIYNSVPTSLHRDMARVRELSPCEVRLDITTESENEAAEIIKYYVNLIKGDMKEKDISEPDILRHFTHGHFKESAE